MCIEAIALTFVPGIGAKGAAHLLDVFGDAASVYAASEEELTGEAQLRPDLAKALLRKEGMAAAEREMRYCRRNGIEAIASTDPRYPALLREIPDYPAVLYLTGNAEALSMHTLSIVGTRRATPYGVTMCDRLVHDLAQRVSALCIVSGLAFGIDAAAHRAAISAGVPTVGVLASPLPQVTPAQHAPLARDMAAHGGALITETHSQTPQRGTGYLARNRIIAAMSRGIIVVEAPESSGSLHTASCADGYQRVVMALPGRVTDKSSQGTNSLIYNRKAQLIQSADEIIRELMWDFGPASVASAPTPPTTELTPLERRLLDFIPESDPIALQDLGTASGFDIGTLSSLLVSLEIAGCIRHLPGNRYLKG